MAWNAVKPLKRGVAYYQCTNLEKCRFKWKLRNSTGSTKDCPECGQSGIEPYKFVPNPPEFRRKFGDFDCVCGNSWKSAYTWVSVADNIAKWQKCLQCNAEVYPSSWRPLLYMGGSPSQGHHESSKCQRCIELGGDCRNYVTPKEVDEIPDDVSVMSEASSVSSAAFSGPGGNNDTDADGDRTPVASDTEVEALDELLSEQLKDLDLK